MTPRPLFSLLAGLLLSSAPAFAQDKDYSKKDYKRAKAVVEHDSDYGEIDTWTWMPEAERALLKEQIIETIAAKLDGKKPSEFKKIDVVAEEGRTKKSVAGRTYSGTPRYIKYDGKSYQVVELEQDIPEIAETTQWVEDPIRLDNFGNLFEDNKWAPGGKNAATVADSLKKVKDIIAQSNGDRKITGIMIKSSASTLKNTVKDKEGNKIEMTHADLALKRAEAARDFIQEKLGAIAKDVPVEINADGVNYDEADPTTHSRKGTSGPTSPYPCPNGVDPKYCPTGDDEYLNKICAEPQQDGAPADVDADADDATDKWDWNDDIEFDCEEWEHVKKISATPYNKWTKGDKALIRSFYAPFKYVGVKITAIKKVPVTKKSDGKAHMVLAIVEDDPVVGTVKLKYKSHFDTPKGKRPPKTTRKTTRSMKKECKNAHKNKKMNKHGLYK